MALEGNLRDFNILEVIQLLGQQGKSGILRAWREGNKVEIYFSEGRIVHAIASPRHRFDLLGERLVRAGVISHEELERSLKEQRDSFAPLGELLIRKGLVSEEMVREALEAQVHEVIYDLFHWQEGKFRFEVFKVKVPRKLPTLISAEELMLNVLRMADEWPAIEEKIPTRRLVLAKVEEGKELEGHLREVFELVDGTSDVDEILQRSLLGEFTTLESLVWLMDHGYIVPVGAKEEERGIVPTKARPLSLQLPVDLRKIALGALILALLVGAFFPLDFSFLTEGITRDSLLSPRYASFLERGRGERLTLTMPSPPIP